MNLKKQSNTSFFLKKKYLRYIVALLTLTCILLFSYYLKNNNSNLDQKHSGNATMIFKPMPKIFLMNNFFLIR